MLVPAPEQPPREWRGGAWAPEQESRPWARPGPPGLWFGGISATGKNPKGTLSGIPSSGGPAGPGPEGEHQGDEGPGQQEAAPGGPRAVRRAPPGPSNSGGSSGRGSALPRICEVELCRACSPIFWMALKYTSAAWDRAAWGQAVPVAPAPPPPSAPALWRPLLAGKGVWRGQGGAEASGKGGVLGGVCGC